MFQTQSAEQPSAIVTKPERVALMRGNDELSTATHQLNNHERRCVELIIATDVLQTFGNVLQLVLAPVCRRISFTMQITFDVRDRSVPTA